jgi:hypothetical protein
VASRRHLHHAFERTPGDASRPLPAGYRPRHPQVTALYGIVAQHLETMLAEARARSPHGFGLPHHVEQTFRRYIDCGRLERGFCRVACPSCHFEMLVPWACKTRGLCSSCDGRRMTQTAAHLVTNVLAPEPVYRQWTLSFPHRLRFRLLRDAKLASAVLTAVVRVVFAYHRRRARELGIADGHAGSISVPQRFGSFGNCHWHGHIIIPDGVFVDAADGRVSFRPLSPPTDDDIATLAARIARRTTRIVARYDDAAGDDEPPDALALAQADAIQLPLALQHRHAELAPKPSRSLCALVDGFSLHAATFVPSGDHAALERLLRYILRPAVIAERISLRPDGRVELTYRKPDPCGRTSWVTDGPELLRRFAALIPPRRVHSVKYHGVFSSAHKLRSRIVVTPAPDGREPGDRTGPTRPSRLCWAALLERVFGSQITACPRCGERVRVIAFITDPDVTVQILNHLAIATEPIDVAPARAPPAACDDFA